MAGQSYVTKGYSTYNDVPTHEGGYAYRPNQAVNYYVVETTTVERVRGPAARYTNFAGAPREPELLRENMPKYAGKDHYEDYESDYGSDHEESSPPGYRGRENLIDKFLNKVHIGASRPTKTSNHSSPDKYRPMKTSDHLTPDKYRPTSPTHSYPTKEGHKIKTQNLPAPDKYRPTSPPGSHSTEERHKTRTENLLGPKKYRPTSPTYGYPSDEGHKIKTQSFPGPDKYHPTSPTHDYPSKEGHMIKAKNFPGPNKYRPTSPIHDYPSKEGHMIKAKNFPGPNKYRPTSPTHDYPSEEGHKIKAHNFPGPNKYRPISPTHSYPSEVGHKIRTQNLIGPNKHQATSPMHNYPSKEDEFAWTSTGPNQHRPSSPGSEGGRYVTTGSFPTPNNHWNVAGPPATRHPLTTPTNDINEALGFLMESAHYSPRSGPPRASAFNNLSPRAHPVEPERQYSRHAFAGTTTQPHLVSNTIDSREAMRKYKGALVP